MRKTSRRKFLSNSGTLLAVPFLTEPAAANPVDSMRPPAMPVEPPWREPGQTKDAAYLRTAALRYSAEGREIVGHNRTCFNNRPLYCLANTEGVVLAGDRPFVRLLAKPYVLGGFSAAIVRDGAGNWFHEYSEVESRYRCGRMTWRISDEALPGVGVTLDVVPLADTAGFALRFAAKGVRAGDKLIWSFGGARLEGDVRTKWDPIMHGNPKTFKLGDPRKPEMNLGIDPERCGGNRIIVEGQTFRVFPAPDAPQGAMGCCNREGQLHVAQASAQARPLQLFQTTAQELPLICGCVDLRADNDSIFWAIQSAPPGAVISALPVANPQKSFQDGIDYLKTVERVQIDTPDPRLNAAMASVCHAIDANCLRNPYIFRHGDMAFSINFLGWRVICGATALGWHERVKGDATHYAALQVTDGGGRTQAQPDPARRLCLQGPESRFYGRGHIPRDTFMYNTQTQFFDQVIRDWRATGDPEMEKILRPALELHLEWVRECFDPDDDGLYESYINTLPTDSVWYNGGGSVEESAYAYYAHVAAMDMARRAGDADAAARHQQRWEKISTALTQKLWLNDRGHFGLYVEQGGHGRVHSDAWSLSQFLPIDNWAVGSVQAVQSLYYTEWALERIRLPFGGEICQPSNWVPWKWSVRDTFSGDVCALALAYFQTGLADEGWELLLGATLESAYASSVPGGFSHVGAATDFGDSTHMFARTVVEGLFGYEPDYPNGRIRMHPAIPSAWPKASIKTPDFTFDYHQEGDADHYRLTLEQEAEVWFHLLVRAERVKRVTLNGREIKGYASEGFGCTELTINTGKLATADVAIELAGRVPHLAPVVVTGRVGEQIRLEPPRGKALRWQDFHHAIESFQEEGPTLQGPLANKPGHHLVWAVVMVGELPQRQLFKIQITDPEEGQKRAAQSPREAPPTAQWTCLDLAPYYNGDIRTIFQQQYLSPRPETCSLRLGVDGYSAWTFSYWHEVAPAIDLNKLDQLDDGRGRILTPQNVAFRRFAADRNIAFTSLWDNWPRSVTVPVNQSAEQAWLLVCGTTFPMQTRIANAEIRFRYADGGVEKLELIPPDNFWTLCPWGGYDYNYDLDAFCLPKQPPPSVQLSENCRAMVLSWKLRPGVALQDVTLETLSQDVVIGLMGVSLMNAKA